MSWLTVVRMTVEKVGLVNPEDLRNTSFNRNPGAAQLVPNDRVDRIRRNDLESLPYFLIPGLLYVTTMPPLWLAQLLFYGFVSLDWRISSPN